MAWDGGVLIRAGHTEAAVDISKIAGLNPSGVICEIMSDDGNMARLPEILEFAKLHNLNFQMHQESRNRLVERFKTDATVPAGSVILMQGGCSETRHETDHEKLFRQESSFNYLFNHYFWDFCCFT